MCRYTTGKSSQYFHFLLLVVVVVVVVVIVLKDSILPLSCILDANIVLPTPLPVFENFSFLVNFKYFRFHAASEPNPEKM